MERKEDFWDSGEPFWQTQQEGMGQKQSRQAGQGPWLQGRGDQKSPVWTEIVLESSGITRLSSTHHLCPSSNCLFCLAASTKRPFTPHRLPLCHLIILLNLPFIQREHPACTCTFDSLQLPSWSGIHYPAVTMPDCDSTATCRLLIYTYRCGPGTLNRAVYMQRRGQHYKHGMAKDAYSL